MAKPEKPKPKFVDRPDLPETFADSIHMIWFDMQTMRIDFCVTRNDEPKPPVMPVPKQYPTCRLVLSLDGAMALHNQLSQLVGALKQQGVVHSVPNAAPTSAAPVN